MLQWLGISRSLASSAASKEMADDVAICLSRRSRCRSTVSRVGL
jgi:hypothetical protein